MTHEGAPRAKRITSVRIATIVCGLLLIAAIVLSIPLFEQTLNTKPVASKVPKAVREAEYNVSKCSEMITKNPNDIAAYQQRALAYIELKRYDLSIGDSTKAMQLDPNRPGPLDNRALAYREAGQLQLALKDCNLLIEKFPRYSHGYAQRAQVFADMGKYSMAAKDITKAKSF